MQPLDRTPQHLTKLAETYLLLKDAVIEQGFEWEIEWQARICFSEVTETDFLRESAWVVLSAGMRETVIRRKFEPISQAFYWWRSASLIADNAEVCRQEASTIFANDRKLKAITTIAERITKKGFPAFKNFVGHHGVDFIQQLPFMGPATSYHLAKNIGLDEVKPDRHLKRTAAATGYSNPRDLCEDIARIVGDRVSVVDVVLWRFATIYPNYLDYFAYESRQQDAEQ
ncbi:MAG: hypothetical protein HY913_19430 [Desulfomonile tiedjei]|nr:hypothetical protein [Desulfomonile tiedjei]